MEDVALGSEPLYPLNIVKKSFTEIYEGKIRFVYRVTLIRKLEPNEKILWDNFILKQKYLFNVADNSQSSLFIARAEKSIDFNLNIVRIFNYSEDRFLKSEFDRKDCDARFMSFISDVFKQFILWKVLREFKPIEESKTIALEDLGIDSSVYTIA